MTKQTESFLKKRLKEKAKVRHEGQSFALIELDGDFCGLALWQKEITRDGGQKAISSVVTDLVVRWVYYTQLTFVVD